MSPDFHYGTKLTFNPCLHAKLNLRIENTCAKTRIIAQFSFPRTFHSNMKTCKAILSTFTKFITKLCNFTNSEIFFPPVSIYLVLLACLGQNLAYSCKRLLRSTNFCQLRTLTGRHSAMLTSSSKVE